MVDQLKRQDLKIFLKYIIAHSQLEKIRLQKLPVYQAMYIFCILLYEIYQL